MQLSIRTHAMSYPVYQPSGIVPAGAILSAAASVAITVPLAGIYAWLILQLPAVLNFFVSFAFAFMLASLVKRVCVRSKVRNPQWIGRFGVLLGVCGWYVQWSAWLAFQQNANVDLGTSLVAAFQLAGQPATVVAEAMRTASAVTGFSGYLLIGSWLGELWMLLFFPHYMGKMRAEEPFDEAEGRWADYVEHPTKFRLVEQADVHRLMSSPSHSLEDMLVVEADKLSKHYSRLRVYPCQGGENLVSIVTVEIDGKSGGQKVIESSPGNYLRVPVAELDELLKAAPASAGAEAQDPPELADAIERLHTGEFQAAFEEARPYVLADDERLSCDANRICAIACSHSGQWTQAVAYWLALFPKEPSAHNALQLATSTVMTGEVAQGLEWLERARALNKASQEMPDIAILTNMLSALTAANRADAALPLLEQVRDVYAHLHVTDPTFLFGHCVPLFHVFLEKSRAIVDKVLDEEAGREWYVSMLPHLDERGRAELTDWLDKTTAQV